MSSLEVRSVQMSKTGSFPKSKAYKQGSKMFQKTRQTFLPRVKSFFFGWIPGKKSKRRDILFHRKDHLKSSYLSDFYAAIELFAGKSNPEIRERLRRQKFHGKDFARSLESMFYFLPKSTFLFLQEVHKKPSNIQDFHNLLFMLYFPSINWGYFSKFWGWILWGRIAAFETEAIEAVVGVAADDGNILCNGGIDLNTSLL